MKSLTKIIAGILFCALLLILASCAQVDSTGTMKILLHSDSSSKTINVSDTVLDITKYTVTGSGPGGKTFAVDTTSASLTLSGMPLGSWSVQATGLNSSGKEIASGNLDFTLDSTTSPHSITLSSLKGTGSIQIKYDWDSDITQPQIGIKITSSGYSLSREMTPTQGSTSCTVTLNEIPAGSYLLTTTLKNDEKAVTGCAEAIRIANSEKTTGTISFKTSSSYSSDLTTLYVYRSDQSALTGHFSGTADNPDTSSEKTIHLVLDSSYKSSEGFGLSWYFDGTLESTESLSPNGNSYTITPPLGCHIVNAVVSDPNTGNLGSVSWKFNASTSGKKGLAVYTGCVDTTSEASLYLRQDTMVMPLPNEKFFIVTPSCGTARLCSIYNSDFTIYDRHSAADEGWSFLSDVTGGASDPSMNNLSLVSSNRDIRILTYSPSKTWVTFANHGENQAVYNGYYKNLSLTFSGINISQTIPSTDGAGTLLFSDRTLSSFFYFVANGTSVTAVSTTLKPDNLVTLAGTHCRSNRLGCFTNDGKFYTCGLDGSNRNTIWTTTNSGFENITFFKFLNSENLLASDGTKIIPFSLSGETLWIARDVVNTTVKALAVSEDGTFFWVVDNSNRLISYTTADNLIYSIGYVQLPKNIVSATLNGTFLILKADDASLLICRISQGE